jgi:hypothetical protein
MNSRLILTGLVILFVGALLSFAEDRMVIHTGDGEVSFLLSDIENITFEVDGGLVAYYPFNGNANDESGNELNGANHGAALTQDRHGNANSAYHFTAANQNYISVVDNNLLDMHQGEGLTVVFWIRTEVEGTVQAFGGKYNSVGMGGWLIDQTRSGYAYFSGRAPGAFVYNDSSNVVINDNEWHMVVGMIDGRTWSNWVDGELQRTVDSGNPNPSMNNGDPLVIGCYIDVGQRASYFTGDIDDIRIYNRALTEAEISELFEE